ncbi:MAG: hypothetical protein OEU54_07440 [Gemmatimonadota bacterium]|nr:hypothetical protein [Gemmatimonadota bacterium]
MDLQSLAAVAEVIGAAIVVGGVGFAFVQLAHFRRQRRDQAAIELARSFQTPEFAHALRLVLGLPDGVSREQLGQMDPQYEDAAMLVSLTFESVGIMVHRRITTLDMVWELMGGVVLQAWKKLHVWAGEFREENGRPKFDEWIQWLCDQMTKYQGDEPPAYEKYGDWEPKGMSGSGAE